MWIALVNPPSPFLLDERVFPPLGLLRIAAVLEQAGHQVEVMDLAGFPDYVDEARRWMAARPPFDVAGIGFTTPQFPRAVAVLRMLREDYPSLPVMAGGSHPSVQPQSCIGLFDAVVAGDGEEMVFPAIQVGRCDGEPGPIFDAATKVSLLVQDLNVLPLPARHLIDMNSYRYALMGRKGTSVISQLGCPFGCTFCCGRNLKVYRKVRVRTPENIVAEVRHLQEVYGMQAVVFYDDELNLLPDQTIQLCQALKPLGVIWRAFVKAELFTPEIARAMVEGGCREVCTGVESGDDRILKIIRKNTTAEINHRARRIAKEHGLRFKAFTSIGHPGEDREAVQATKRWLLEAQPDDFDVTIITIYPGTPIYDHPEQFDGLIFYDRIDYSQETAYYKGIPGDYVSYVWTPWLSKEELVQLRDEVEDDARKALGIPYPKSFTGDHVTGEQFEHSMGMGLRPELRPRGLHPVVQPRPGPAAAASSTPAAECR